MSAALKFSTPSGGATGTSHLPGTSGRASTTPSTVALLRRWGSSSSDPVGNPSDMAVGVLGDGFSGETRAASPEARRSTACEWCGLPFDQVTTSRGGRPQVYCSREVLVGDRVLTCRRAAEAWKLLEQWTGAAILEPLAEGHAPAREAASTLRERVMSIRAQLRDPTTGRLL